MSTLSPVMQNAIEFIQSVGGILFKYPGGYWMKPELVFELDEIGCAKVINNRYVETNTIKALITRGILEVIEMQQAKHNGISYPSRVKLAERNLNDRT